MAVLVNKTWYTNFGNGTTTGYYAATKWAAGGTVTVGQLFRQNTAPAVGSERMFIYIVAGTSATPTEPTWVLTKGAKTTDGTATAMECSGMPAVNGDVTNTPLSSANRSGAQVLGNIVKDNASTYYFICTTAGTTGAGEPTWVTTVGSTTTDSGCTWTCIGAVGAFGAWAAPIPRLSMACSWIASGDTIYVSSSHVESQSTTQNLLFTSTLAVPTTVMCVSNTSYNPPLSADVTTGASMTTGSNILNVQGNGVNIIGITFTTTGGNALNIGNTATTYIRMQNCTLGTTGGAQISLGNSNGVNTIELYNITILSGILTTNSAVIWRGGTALGSATQFINGGGYYGRLYMEGVDLSAVTGSLNNIAMGAINQVVLSGCKLASTVTVGQATNPRAWTIDLLNCDSGTATYRHERWCDEGSQVCDLVVLRTSGASDGTTALAWKITTTTYTTWFYWFECMPITIWNSVVGSNVNVTLQGLYNGSALPYNDQIWLETKYYGSSSSPLLSTVTGTKANALATHSQYSASTVAWDSIASTRLNSNAYSLGNYFRLSSNPGQLFICTTAGTSASSQPGAYTSVADGTLVTDGSAVFRPLVRFSMTVTLTSPQPQIAGYIRCYVRAALASSTFWIDPLITLS